MNYILNLIPQYGYILVYALLTVELMGVPFLPGEILMVYCGFLVFKGKLNFILLFISATFGVISGLTSSYLIGNKLGSTFFYKHGSKFHFGPEKIEKVSNLLNKYGLALIVFICFIPGLKHVIGYFSGMSSMNFKKYAIGGYLGAGFWSLTFLCIGNALGSNWNQFHKYLLKYLVTGAILITVLILLFYIIKIYRKKIFEFITKIIIFLANVFKSLESLRIFVLITTIVCIVCIDAFINIVQGLLNNNFAPFNEITYYLIEKIFMRYPIFSSIFKFLNILTSDFMYILIPLLLIMFILYKSTLKSVEIKYLILTVCGGFFIKFILNYIVNILSSNIEILRNLLDGRCFTVIIIYGFTGYILIKHINNNIVKKAIVIIFLVISCATGVTNLFFKNDLSSVLAGYSLGSVWLTLNIILLEITNVLPNLKKSEKEIVK